VVGGAAVLAVAGAILPTGWETEVPAAGPSSRPEIHAAVSPSLDTDPRVMALLEAYGPLIDSVAYNENDAVFSVMGGEIHFQDGRLLSERNLGRSELFHSLFYEYPLSPLRTPPPLTEQPVFSRDFVELLFGRTETEIRNHGVSTTFLNRRVFVNLYCLEALRAVEQRIFAAAESNREVAAWMDQIEVAYSFIDKEIVGSGTRSYHAWGLAVDLIPSSYHGKHVYWRWSRVFDREGWHRIPISHRWSPPQQVIEAFEENGFVWGGKWSHFDTIHFEYRPEILAFNRMMARGRP
jgi:hypothetical protein